MSKTTINQLSTQTRYDLALEIAPYWDAVSVSVNIEVYHVKKMTDAHNKDCEGYSKRLVQWLSDKQSPIKDLLAVLNAMGKQDAIDILLEKSGSGQRVAPPTFGTVHYAAQPVCTISPEALRQAVQEHIGTLEATRYTGERKCILDKAMANVKVLDASIAAAQRLKKEEMTKCAEALRIINESYTRDINVAKKAATAANTALYATSVRNRQVQHRRDTAAEQIQTQTAEDERTAYFFSKMQE